VTSPTATPSSPPGGAIRQAVSRVRDWRARAGLAAAIAAIAVVVAVPTQQHRAAPRPVQVAATGQPALSSRWPAARPFPIPSVLPGGLSFRPKAVLSRSTTAGVATSADKRHVSLVLASESGPPRTLQTAAAGLASFGAITTYGGQLFWMHTSGGADGQRRTSLWSAPLAGGGPSRQLAADAGTPRLDGTRYALQQGGGRLYWTDSHLLGDTATRLRSIPVTGGPVTARAIAGRWQPSAWPWLVTFPPPGKPAELLNLLTGARTVVRAPAGKALLCGHSWCRISADALAQAQDTAVMRPDGSDYQRIAGGTAFPIADEVALEDRFEPLSGSIDPTSVTRAAPLSLYDIETATTILVDPAATEANASGDYLWWSSGDHEILAWHGLDLRTLR
jgi:hypothetical protein